MGDGRDNCLKDTPKERGVGSLVLLKQPIRFLGVSIPLPMLVFTYPNGGWRLVL